MLAKAAFDESVGEVRSSNTKHARRERGAKDNNTIKQQPAAAEEVDMGGFVKSLFRQGRAWRIGCRLGGDAPAAL